MSIDEIITINNGNKYNSKINMKDVLNAIKHMEILGTGCKIIDDKYISTSPFALSEDISVLLKVNEQNGKVNYDIVKSSYNWPKERFNNNIVTLIDSTCKRRISVG